MKTHENPTRGRRRVLAALAILVTLSWFAQQAAAHPYWAPRPTVTPLDGKVVNNATVYRVEVKFRLQSITPTGSSVDSSWYSTMGLNWCRAKAVLPADWDTQDNRALRTGSMCQEPPFYGSLGKDYPHSNDPPWGDRKWTTPDNYSFADGRYIFSINGWSGNLHGHAYGNHTMLYLFNIDVPDGKSPSSD